MSSGGFGSAGYVPEPRSGWSRLSCRATNPPIIGSNHTNASCAHRCGREDRSSAQMRHDAQMLSAAMPTNAATNSSKIVISCDV